jgi:hypothetical protein
VTTRYELFGLSVESPFVLPGAPVAGAGHAPPDVVVTWDEAPWDGADEVVRLAPARAGLPSVAGLGDGSVTIAWGDALRFVIAPAGNHIRVVAPAVKIEYAPTVLVGVVLGYLLHLRGTLCLHGAVLARGGRAISLLGASGAGKSTLTTALVLSGATLLSDDVTVVRRTATAVLAEAGCATVRLGTESAERLLGGSATLPRVPYIGKLLWDTSSNGGRERFAARALPLETLYVLDARNGDGDVEVSPPLSRVEALRRLIGAWYPPDHRQLLTHDRLADLSTLAADVPVRIVRHAKTWDQLPRLVELLGD